MKKGIILLVLMCTMALTGRAQVYAYDQYVKLPTRDIYDTDLMMMELNLLERTKGQRLQTFNYYTDLAVDAFTNHQWSYAILYTDKALETHYYNCELYYIRGYANEQLGNERQAKKDYKQGVEYGSKLAAQALEELKAKKK